MLRCLVGVVVEDDGALDVFVEEEVLPSFLLEDDSFSFLFFLFDFFLGIIGNKLQPRYKE